MLFQSQFITMMLTTVVSGCIHHKGKEQDKRLSGNVLKLQKTCDLDAFLCQNELDFTFPQDIFRAPALRQEEQVTQGVVYDPIGDILNDMIHFSMEMSSPVVFFSSEEVSDFDVMDKIMDDMISSFFQNIPSSSDNVILLERIHSHGRRLLQENNDPKRQRLARKLSSIQHPKNPGHAFNNNVEKCLWKRMNDHTLISKECAKALQDSNTQEYYLLDTASFVVVLITFFMFTITTLLLFKILLGSSIESPRLGSCACFPVFALCTIFLYLTLPDPTLVIIIGTPVILALGCYSCVVGDETCEKCDVATDSLCGECGACVNCCQCLQPLLVNEIEGDAVYVAIPAVI